MQKGVITVWKKVPPFLEKKGTQKAPAKFV